MTGACDTKGNSDVIFAPQYAFQVFVRKYLHRYVIEYGVLTGTKLHESLPKYALLKELGAFKGAGGGVQPEFKEGLSEQQLAAAKKALEVSARRDTR